MQSASRVVNLANHIALLEHRDGQSGSTEKPVRSSSGPRDTAREFVNWTASQNTIRESESFDAGKTGREYLLKDSRSIKRQLLRKCVLTLKANLLAF
jgi:hypothetical protein